MKWFFAVWGATVGVLFLGFVAWIATRTMHADGANYVVGKIIIYDLYALGAGTSDETRTHGSGLIMRYGYWMPVFGGWLRNVPDEGMEASWEYVKKLAQRSEQIGYDLTLIAAESAQCVSCR